MYGSTVTETNGSFLPHCVICYIAMSNDSMRLEYLEYHLIIKPGLRDKPIEFLNTNQHKS